MHIIPPALEIGDNEGFTTVNDIFKRATIGRGLTNFVMHVTDPAVIAVDGQWGSGKTAFLKMWAGELRNAKFPVVYFDAFENDYAEDAFTAIASEIIALAQELDKSGTSTAKNFVSKAIGAGKIILRSGLKLGLKLGTAGVLDAEELEKIADDVATEVSELEDQYLGELLTKQRGQKVAIQSFREALASLPALLTSAKKQNDDAQPAQKPLIIIIDELDRCRPVFALQILERIKHFFSVPNVHFVLGTHLKQLRNSVMAAYGSQFDAHTYLQKFIHLTLPLVDSPFDGRRNKIASTYVDYLIAVMGLPKIGTLDYARDYFRYVMESRNLSLRAIERIMSTYSIVLAFPQVSVFSPVAVVVGLCVLKTVDPELYFKAKTGTPVWDELKGVLGFAAKQEEWPKGVVNVVGEDWRLYTSPNLTPDEVSLITKRLGSSGSLSREQVIPYVANAVIDRLSQT
jgi:hypothetical protein